MNYTNEKCVKLSSQDLVYQSSEQYLISCLKLCNLIIKNKCSIDELINLNQSNQLFSHLNSTECHKYSHKESHKITLFILGAILCFTILLLNSLTLVTILKSRRLHSIQNILIANLSISDFLSGVSFLYPCILNLLTINALETYNSSLYQLACMIRQYYYLCLAGYSPMITSMLSSMFTLTLLALEKYLAILHPYLYERLVHEHQYGCYLCLILTWTISILVSLLPLMGWNEIMNKSNFVPCMFEKIFTLDYILLFTSICCLCALTMLAIYLRIYFIARKHSKQIAKIHSVFSNNQSSNDSQNSTDNNNNNNNNNININNNLTNNNLQLNYSENTAKFNQNRQSSSSQSNEDEYEMVTFDLKSIQKNEQKELEEIDSSNLIKISESSDSKPIQLRSRIYQIDLAEIEEDENKTSISQSSETIKTVKQRPSNADKSSNHNSLNMNMKAMKTLLILLLGFYTCWLPLIIYFLTFASKKYENLTIYILMFIACCNAVIDPLVYAFRNKEFLRELLENFKRSTSTKASSNPKKSITYTNSPSK